MTSAPETTWTLAAPQKQARLRACTESSAQVEELWWPNLSPLAAQKPRRSRMPRFTTPPVATDHGQVSLKPLCPETRLPKSAELLVLAFYRGPSVPI